MKKYTHLRDKARALRRQGATLPEICRRLALGKSTVYSWIKDIPIARTARQTAQQRLANLAMRRKYAARRRSWYEAAFQTASQALQDPLLRDFVVLYMAEGLKRDRNRVAICNSDPGVVQLAHRYLKALSRSPRIRYRLQCHVDDDEHALRRYWAACLDIEPADISVARKSNAGGLAGRNWRSPHGVLTLEVDDTRLRCIIEAWMDHLKQAWSRVE